MEKKTYRNALRSKAMIRLAFSELICEKSLDQITVTDIVRRSDLSRNTFYAHYQDVYAVLEEYQADAVSRMKNVLDEGVCRETLGDPQPLLKQMAAYIDENKETYRILLRTGKLNDFIGKTKEMLIECMTQTITHEDVSDLYGFYLFVEMLISGFIHLFQLYLNEEAALDSDRIVSEISRIYQACLPLYC